MTTPNPLSRRASLRSLLLPTTALLAGCASTQPRPGATDDSAGDVGFPQRAGASVIRTNGTRAFRNHVLQDQDGRTVRFQQDLIEGQVFAAVFMYVNCKGICSDMIGQMIGAYDLLTPVMGNPVRFYTFSLAQDSPEAMKGYMQSRGIYGRPGWTFLTGTPEVIKDIRWGFGFFDPNEEVDGNLEAHTGMARFGNHRLDKWSSCPALANPLMTARSVVALFPPGERPQIAALQDSETVPARPIPNYRPAPPSTREGA
jgi:protein SCO1/2